MVEETSQRRSFGDTVGTPILRIAVSLAVPILTFVLLYAAFRFMRDSDASRILIAIVALIVGVFGVWMIYIGTDMVVSLLPRRMRDRVRPYVFVGPAIVVLFIYVVWPAVNTLWLSFRDAKGQHWVGLDNFIFIFTDPKMLIVLRNNVLWLVLVTAFAVGIGLVIAVMADRVGKWEPVVKSVIFLPMAISAVGASVIWKFVYAFRPAGATQIGLLNAFVVALGGDPQGWLLLRPGNNLFLIAVMIWLLTGFCMVVISAAVKGVPGELLEAARIDGASEFRIFFNVIIPSIRGTLLTVTTTVLIMVIKVFDIVFVMTSGQFGTQVIANRMFQELFVFRNFGRGSALAIILFIAIIPFIIYNLRSMRESRR